MVISGNQMAFILGSKNLDGILRANEIVSVAKNKTMKLMLFKVDFDKADGIRSYLV